MPRSRQPRVLVVGAGFSGLAVTHELVSHGLTDVTIVDRADGVGGVWRANTYPGAACDVPSHLYSLSFAPNPRWSRRFSPQAEILSYLEDVADRFDLRRRCRFGVEVVEARFDERDGTWTVAFAEGEPMVVDVLVMATGQLSLPATPTLPGAEQYRGHVFHSARWDHDHDLSGRRVGVVGTGASAIQLVPEIAPVAGHTTVFQRSPAYVVHKADRPHGPVTQAAFAAVPALRELYRLQLWLRHEARWPAFGGSRLAGRIARHLPMRHLRAQVDDPDLRAVLEPDEPLGCKRVLQSDDWYPALTRDDVTLRTTGVAAFTPDGVVTDDGDEVALDTVIWATGFQTSRFLAPAKLFGRDGVELNDAWADGARAHLGTVVSGFPNLFVMYGPNTNLGHNSIIYMIESQAPWVRQAVEWLRGDGLRWIDVRADVQQRFDDDLQRRLADTVWAGDCRSWYRDANGRIVNNWWGPAFAYRRATRRLDRTDFATTG